MQASCRMSAVADAAGQPGACRAIPSVSAALADAVVDLRRPHDALPSRRENHARPDPSLPPDTARMPSAASALPPAALVRPLRRAGVRARQALHRVGRLRPAAGARRHRGLARACADARRAAASCRRTISRPSSAGLAQIEREIARGEFAWSRDARGRALQHREAADRARRRRRQAAAHGALAQRPGRDRHAAVAARRDRRARARNWSRCAARCSTSPNATPTRSCRASRTCRSRSR